MSNPESRISTNEIPHFQDGEIKTVEDTARLILNAGIHAYDQTQSYGSDRPLEYCAAKRNVLEINYARRFRVGGYESAKITMAIRLDESSMAVVIEDALEEPLLETYVKITKDAATISYYDGTNQSEDVPLTTKTARDFEQQLLHLADYFEIITEPEAS